MLAEKRRIDNPTMNGIDAVRPSSMARFVARLPLLVYRLGLGEAMNLILVLVLTTRGRHTGSPRFSAMEYRAHGRKLYVLSTLGEDAQWVQNALAQPLVTVQYGSRVITAMAERVTQPGEALMALRLFHGTAPYIYDSVYSPMKALRGRAAVTERALTEITDKYLILRLTPVDTPPQLPALQEDLRWIPPAVGMLSVASFVLAVAAYVWRTTSVRSRNAKRG